MVFTENFVYQKFLMQNIFVRKYLITKDVKMKLMTMTKKMRKTKTQVFHEINNWKELNK